ncbi:hypothetical protein TNCV_2414131 [Trichonephila clavipes]|nr:hypothetical protein TNCV_2414131 [Trichonephila clavipes]
MRKAGRRTTINIDQVRIYHQRKIAEGMVDAESSVSSGSQYQSSSLERNRPRLGPSQGFRSSKTGEKREEEKKNTSFAGNKSGRREQQENKRKRSSSSKEPFIGLMQQKYKKSRQEVMEFKRNIPASWSPGPDRKKSRKPSRENERKC